MIRQKHKRHSTINVALIASILFATSALHAEESPTASKVISETTKEFLSDPARTGSLLGSILVGAAIPNPLSPLLGSLAGFLIGKSSAYSDTDKEKAPRNRNLMPDNGAQITRLTGLTGKPLPASDQMDTIGSTPIGLALTSLAEDTEARNLSEQNEPIVIVGPTPMSSSIRLLSKLTATDEQTEQTAVTANTLNVLENRSLASNFEQIDSSEQAVNQELTRGSGARSRLQQQLASACSNVQLSQPLSLGCYYHSQ